MSSTRPRLTPAIADVRRAVRDSLALLSPSRSAAPGATPTDALGHDDRADVLVALSGGPDSLALAAATAFEAKRARMRAGAVIIDHGLQEGSADVAAQAAQAATSLGLDPVMVKRVEVGTTGGPEAAAREARYEALSEALEETNAVAVLLGHTLDDQAETVLLGLARGSGAGSLQGMAPTVPALFAPRNPASLSAEIRKSGLPEVNEPQNSGSQPAGQAEWGAGSLAAGRVFLRPLLSIRRSTTVKFCTDSRLEPWTDPHNSDRAFTRVRVREVVLPLLEKELGPGIAEALARTAAQVREDAEALDHFAEEQIEELAEHAEAGISLGVKALAANPPALRQRIIRLAVSSEFGVSLSRSQTLEVARLVTEWHGQGPIDLPGIRVKRQGHLLVFSASPMHREP